MGSTTYREYRHFERDRALARRFQRVDVSEPSVADTVIVPLQDVLGLGTTARMNLPGRPGGNWRFRFRWDQVTPEITTRLRDLVATYERGPFVTRED